MIKGLHHISIIASTEKTIEFYVDLGFQEISRIKRSNDSVAFLEGFGIRLIVFIDPKHPKRSMDPEQLGVRYFALQVDNIEEMAERYGCDSVKKDWNGERYFVLKDPDGVLIQFHE